MPERANSLVTARAARRKTKRGLLVRPTVGREISVPENAGGDRAPGSPGDGHSRELFRVGDAAQLLDVLCGSGQRQITLRPDVGPAKRHQEIDVCGPRTDAGKLQQDGADCLITELGEGSEVECAANNSSGQIVTVGCLLSGETSFPKLASGGGCNIPRGDSTNEPLKSAICSFGGREGDLLFKNDANQRGEAWASSP